MILVFTALGVFFYQSLKTAINKANTLHLAEAVSKKFNETFGTETNKVLEINIDNMGELVEASGGIVVQNTKAFVFKGFKFEQGSIQLKTADEVSAYLSLLNSNDQKGYTDRLQDVAISIFENLKKPSVLARHSLAILKSFPEVVNTNISFPDFMNMVKRYNKALKVRKINVHATKIPDGSGKMITPETLDNVKGIFGKSFMD